MKIYIQRNIFVALTICALSLQAGPINIVINNCVNGNGGNMNCQDLSAKALNAVGETCEFDVVKLESIPAADQTHLGSIAIEQTITINLPAFNHKKILSFVPTEGAPKIIGKTLSVLIATYSLQNLPKSSDTWLIKAPKYKELTDELKVYQKEDKKPTTAIKIYRQIEGNRGWKELFTSAFSSPIPVQNIEATATVMPTGAVSFSMTDTEGNISPFTFDLSMMY